MVIDKSGYIRGEIEHSDLISRKLAYNEIYLKNKDKYPLPFSKYVVHHIDGDKFNNSVKNLLILTREEHKKIHKIFSDSFMQKEFDEVIKKIKKLKSRELKQMLESFKK